MIKIPSIIVRSTAYDVNSTAYNVRSTELKYDVRRTEYNDKSTEYNIKITEYNAECTEYNDESTKYNARITEYNNIEPLKTAMAFHSPRVSSSFIFTAYGQSGSKISQMLDIYYDNTPDNNLEMMAHISQRF